MKRSILILSGVALTGFAACNKQRTEETPQPVNVLATAKGGSGGGGGSIPATISPSVAGTWLGENRWGTGVSDARRWTLSLSQSSSALTGRLITEMTTETGTTVEGEGNISVNGTLNSRNVAFTMRPKRGGSVSTFIGMLSADGRTMRGVNWVPTVPTTILGDTMTLVKQ